MSLTTKQDVDPVAGLDRPSRSVELPSPPRGDVYQQWSNDQEVGWQRWSERLSWGATALIVLLPALVALDFGGVLAWTQHVTALVVSLCCAIALSAIWLGNSKTWAAKLPRRSYAVCGLISSFALLGFVQTIPLDADWVHVLSPAGHAVQMNWAAEAMAAGSEHLQQPEPVIEAMGDSSRITASIAPVAGQHVTACLLVLALLALTVPLLLAKRERFVFAWLGLALGGATIACIGLLRMLVPEMGFFSFLQGGEGAPFGTFLNRNNAALGMLLGLACSAGILRWQTLKIRAEWASEEVDLPRTFEVSDLSYLLNPVTLIAVGGCLASLLGLLFCGSRAGILCGVISVLVFTLLCKGTFLRRYWKTVAVSIFVTSFVLITQPRVNQAETPTESVWQQRWESLTNDDRYLHWPDGFRAAMHYFPFGSGLGSYGYAYLPFQRSSPWRWCVHADNLWLEVLCEAGLVGALGIACLFGLLLFSAIRLSRSSYLFDQGMSVTAVILIPIMAISQALDFGLLVPSNALAFTIILSALVGRAFLAGLIETMDRNTEQRGRAFGASQATIDRAKGGWDWGQRTSSRVKTVPLGIACAALLLTLPALLQLGRDSRSMTETRLLRQQLAAGDYSLDWLVERERGLSELAANHPHPELLTELVALQFQLGRFQELESMDFAQRPDVQRRQLLFATRPVNRRLCWRISQEHLRETVSDANRSLVMLRAPDPYSQAAESYRRALRSNQQLLRYRPLSVDARRWMVALEFAHQSPGHTTLALWQSARLHCNSPETLFNIGLTAARHSDSLVATSCWSRVSMLKPSMIRRVEEEAKRHRISLTDTDSQPLKQAKRPASSPTAAANGLL